MFKCNKWDINEIAQNLFILPAGGSYSTVLEGKNEILIIDTGFEKHSIKSDSIIKSNFHKPVKYIINSHSHFDHVGGNEYYADENTIIIGPENVRKEMQKTWGAPNGFNYLPVIQPYSGEALPDVCYMDLIETILTMRL